ncbi:MAG: 16S rRNA processing protein RimM [Chloroflexi bacterium]|nr:16S rRNA processing protein RimM [Chloroflexota bacterium]
MAGRVVPEYLVIGRVVAPWGRSGEIKVALETDFPHRFALLREVFVGPDRTPRALLSSRLHQGHVILRLAGCDDRNAAEGLRGLEILIPISQAMPLEEGQYYLHQIFDLHVYDESECYLGQVMEILVTGSNDVYVVRDGERELLIPALADVILRVDLEQGRMIVRLPKGLDEL